MSNKKVEYCQGNVPFSWENKPGVSKIAPRDDSPVNEYHEFAIKLPPPPCQYEYVRPSFNDLRIPLPPCAFQPPSRGTSRRGLRKQDDPFLVAYKECTKTKSLRSGAKKSMLMLSCKNSCGVREDGIIRNSQLPLSRSRREVDGDV